MVDHVPAKSLLWQAQQVRLIVLLLLYLQHHLWGTACRCLAGLRC